MKLPLPAYVEIARPLNVIMTFLSVFIAAMLSRMSWAPFFNDIFWAAVSASLIAAGGNVINDYCDRILDRIDKPQRPIPSGRISAQAAIWMAFSCFIFGILISLTLPFPAVIIAVAAAIFLTLYSYIWKRQPFTGNLVVAFIASLAFIYSGISVGKIGVAVWPAALAFLFHLGREITKDMEDREGDAALGMQTIAVKYGLTASKIAATLTFACLAAVISLPYVLGPFRQGYLWIACFGVVPVILFTAVWIWIKEEPEQLHLINTVQKFGMLLGLLALYAGRPETILSAL